jgi:hypothetical protein
MFNSATRPKVLRGQQASKQLGLLPFVQASRLATKRSGAERSNVLEVLRSTAGSLLPDKCLTTDERHRDIEQRSGHSIGPRIRKTDSGNGRHDVDAVRRLPTDP